MLSATLLMGIIFLDWLLLNESPSSPTPVSSTSAEVACRWSETRIIFFVAKSGSKESRSYRRSQHHWRRASFSCLHGQLGEDC